MTTVISDNVHNFAVEGTSDELDIPIKKIFADWDYKNKHNLCSINSLNWARVLIQGCDIQQNLSANQFTLVRIIAYVQGK